MTDYILSCCSTADLSKEHFEARDIEYLCAHYTLDGVEYRDDLGRTLPFDKFYDALKAGKKSSTYQLNVSEYYEHFEKFLKRGLDVVHVCLSSGITSGTISAARTAAEMLSSEYPEDKVYAVDSLGASSGYGLLMDKLADKRDEGLSAAELSAWAEENRLYVNHWFFSTDLTFYVKGGRYPYVYVDGIYLRRNWGGEYENVAILVAIAVNEDGYREVLGAAEGMKEDKASWVSFFQWLRGRGLSGVKLIVGDKCQGMLEAVGEVFPEAKYQRCVVHFYRNVFSVVPKSKVKLVAKMLKAIHAQESKKAAREKAKAVVAELRTLKLKEAAQKIEDGVEETLTYADFPSEHWTRIRTNNVIERLNREIRRRTRVVGCFPDGNSALMLVCARLRHVAGTQWGNKKYMNMKHLEAVLDDTFIAG